MHMYQVTKPVPHSYSVFEYKESCDNKTEKVDFEEECVRSQLEGIMSRTKLIDSQYESCVAQFAGGHINGVLDQIQALSAKKRDLEMQKTILNNRLMEVKRRLNHNNHEPSVIARPKFRHDLPLYPVVPHIENWSLDVYNHTNSRTLNKRKFVSPVSILGGSAGSCGQYNYSYFNDQPLDAVQIIEYTTPVTISSATTDTVIVSSKPKQTFPIPCPSPKGNPKTIVGATVHINDIISRTEDSRHVIILRGLPGSGKSSFCQAFKEAELSKGHSAPRILSIDHFFMDDGKYEYDATLEATYREELFRLFKRQVDEGFFSVMVVDSINERVDHFSQFYHYARTHSFQPSILELTVSPTICAKRSEHKFDPLAVYKMADNWEETPSQFLKLDATSFLQDSAIEDVEMEDIEEDTGGAADGSVSEEEDEEADDLSATGFFKSKWDEDFQETKERLDGTKQLGHEHNVFNIQDFLRLEAEDMYKTKQDGPVQGKHVKWADFEELKQQKRRKELGFVAGYTDWNKIMSDDIEVAESALVQVKYYVKDLA